MNIQQIQTMRFDGLEAMTLPAKKYWSSEQVSVALSSFTFGCSSVRARMVVVASDESHVHIME